MTKHNGQVVCLALLWMALTCSLTFSNSQNPPLLESDYHPQHLVYINSIVNLTCPYSQSLFYKWTYSAQPTNIISESQTYSFFATSTQQSGVYLCTAINGFGQSLARFALRVLDLSDPRLVNDCVRDRESISQSSIKGPCFLHTLAEKDLTIERESGDNELMMDCEAVMHYGLPGDIRYTWKQIPTFTQPQSHSAGADDTLSMLLLPESSSLLSSTQQQSDYSIFNPTISGEMFHKTGAFSAPRILEEKGPHLILSHLNIRMSAMYECSVTSVQNPKAGTLRRTFNLVVKERRRINYIFGSKFVNITPRIGDNVDLECRVSSIVKPVSSGSVVSFIANWGKLIDTSSSSTSYDEGYRKVWRTPHGLFRTLPSTHVKETLVYLTNTDLNSLEKENVGGQMADLFTKTATLSRYRMENIRREHEGKYICLVTVGPYEEDFKIFTIQVQEDEFATLNSVDSKGNVKIVSETNHLLVYISIPLLILVASLIAMVYCLVTRQQQQKARCQGPVNSTAAGGGMIFNKMGSPNLLNRPGFQQVAQNPQLSCPQHTINGAVPLSASGNSNNNNIALYHMGSQQNYPNRDSGHSSYLSSGNPACPFFHSRHSQPLFSSGLGVAASSLGSSTAPGQAPYNSPAASISSACYPPQHPPQLFGSLQQPSPPSSGACISLSLVASPPISSDYNNPKLPMFTLNTIPTSNILPIQHNPSQIYRHLSKDERSDVTTASSEGFVVLDSSDAHKKPSSTTISGNSFPGEPISRISSPPVAYYQPSPQMMKSKAGLNSPFLLTSNELTPNSSALHDSYLKTLSQSMELFT